MAKKRKDPVEEEIKRYRNLRIREYDAKRIFYDMYVTQKLKTGLSVEDIAKGIGKPVTWVIARIKELNLDG